MATIRAAAQRLNTSARSFDDVTRLAEQAPQAAKTYLKEVATHLRKFGEVAKAKSIEDLLDDKDLGKSLKDKETKLGKIWPDKEGGWGALQAERAQTVGWQPVETNKLPPTYVTGKVKIDEANGTAQLVTENGAKLNLVSGGDMGDWFNGMVDDGELTFKGKLDVNGNFKVTGFALNEDGKFDEFVFGRVAVDGNRVYVETAEGEVDITNADLKKKLKLMPQLGIILPGEAEKHGSKFRYGKDPSEMFALGRFTDYSVKNAEGNIKGKHALCDMAYSAFASQALLLPKGQEGRADHGDRFWARGDFKYLREKKDEWGGETLTGQFQASYLSKASDGLSLYTSAASDADAVRAAVLLAEADDDIKGSARAAAG